MLCSSRANCVRHGAAGGTAAAAAQRPLGGAQFAAAAARRRRCNSGGADAALLGRGAAAYAGGRRNPLQRLRAVADDEEDLMQFPDRLRWYEAKFAADDMPDWNAATLLRRDEPAPGVAVVALAVEVSRERVPLRNAYVAAGQLARVRVNGGEERLLPVASAPPGAAANSEALFFTRGDIFAGDTKSVREPSSAEATVELVVERSAAPELFNIQIDDDVEVGPFEGGGLDLRTPGLLAAFRFPTVVIFASGAAGIAAARALLESPPDVAGLALPLRRDVVVYYWVPNEAAALFRERFAAWRAELGPVRVVVTTRGFADAFDGDDALVYEPEETAAVILTGGDAEAEAAARAVCAEAEIAAVVADGEHAAPPVFLDATPQSFQKWAKRHPRAAAPAPEASDGAAGAQREGQASGGKQQSDKDSDGDGDDEGAAAAAAATARSGAASMR